MLSKIMETVKKYRKDLILSAIILLLSLLCFAIGFIVAKQQGKQDIQFKTTNLLILCV